jgi:hypothetical protein
MRDEEEQDEEEEEDETHEEDDEDEDDDEESTSSKISNIDVSRPSTASLDFDYDPESARGVSRELVTGNLEKRKKKIEEEIPVIVPAWQSIIQLTNRLASQQHTKELTAVQVGVTFNPEEHVIAPVAPLKVKGNKASVADRKEKKEEPAQERSLSPQTMASLIVARSKSPLVNWQTPLEDDDRNYYDDPIEEKVEKPKKKKKNDSVIPRGILEDIIEFKDKDEMETIQHKFSLGLSLKMALWLATSRRKLHNRYEQARKYIIKLAKKRGIHTHIVNEPLREGLPDDDEYVPPEQPHYYQQGNLQMYTSENIRRRLALKQDPKIQQVINQWWSATVKVKNKPHISKRTYMSLGMAVYTVMMPASTGKTLEDARRSTEEDWVQDTRGSHIQAMDYKQFYTSIFQLADIWCESIDLNEYVMFLTSLFDAVYVDATLPKVISRHIDRDYIKQLLLQGGATVIPPPPPPPAKERKKKLFKPKRKKIRTPVTPSTTGTPNTQRTTKSVKAKEKLLAEPAPTPPRLLAKETNSGSDSDVSQPRHPRVYVTKSVTNSPVDKSSTLLEHEELAIGAWEDEEQQEVVKKKILSSKQRSEADRRREEQLKHARRLSNRKEPKIETPVQEEPTIEEEEEEEDEDISQVVNELAKRAHDKSIHRGLLEVLNQHDNFVLERTIFSRMISSLNNETPLLNDSPMKLGSELVTMMQNGVISDVYQTYMRQKNKLNPLELMEAFLQLKQKGAKRPLSGSVSTTRKQHQSRPSTAPEPKFSRAGSAASSRYSSRATTALGFEKTIEEQLGARLVSKTTWNKLIEISNSLLADDQIEEIQEQVKQLSPKHVPNKLTTNLDDKKISQAQDNDLVIYETTRKTPQRPKGKSAPQRRKVQEPVIAPEQVTPLKLPIVRDTVQITQFKMIQDPEPSYRSEISTNSEYDNFDEIVKEMNMNGGITARSKASDLSSWWDEDHDHTKDVIIAEKESVFTPISTARSVIPKPISAFVSPRKDNDEFKVSVEDLMNSNPFYVQVKDPSTALADRIREKKLLEQQKWERLYGHKKVSSPYKVEKQPPPTTPSSGSVRKSWYVPPSTPKKVEAPPVNEHQESVLEQLSIPMEQIMEELAEEKEQVKNETNALPPPLTIAPNMFIRPSTAPTSIRPERVTKNTFKANFPSEEQRKSISMDDVNLKRPETASPSMSRGKTPTRVRYPREIEDAKAPVEMIEDLVGQPVQENLAGIRQLLQSKKRKKPFYNEPKPVPLPVSRLVIKNT